MSTTYHLEITLKKNNQGTNKLIVDFVHESQRQRLNTYNTGPSIPGDTRNLYLIARPQGSNAKLALSWKNIIGNNWNLYSIETNNEKKLEIKLIVQNGYDGPFVSGSTPRIFTLTKPNFDISTGPNPAISSRGIRRADFTEQGNIVHIYNTSTIDSLGSFVGGPFPYELENSCCATYHDVGVPNPSNPQNTGELVLELVSKSSGNVGIEKYDVVFGGLTIPIYLGGLIDVNRRVYDSTTSNYKDEIDVSISTLQGPVGPLKLETPGYVLDTYSVHVQFYFRVWNVSKTSNFVVMNPGNLNRTLVENNDGEMVNHNNTIGNLILMSSNNDPFQPGSIDD